MEWLYILPLTAAVLILAAAYVCYMMTFKVNRAKSKDPYALFEGEQYAAFNEEIPKLVDAVLCIPYEEVAAVSGDGTKLFGRYYEFNKGAPVEILFHGYKGNAYREFCGGLKLAQRSGYNAILVDQRAHGESGGRCLSFGIKEREDAAAWVGYALKRFGSDVPIALVGISMGAATVLMASETVGDGKVKCIIADCPYSSPYGIIKKVVKDMKLPVGISSFFVRLGGIIYGGFDVKSHSAKDAVTKSTVPVLIIHGEDDRFVPCEMSHEIYGACKSEKRIFTVKGAGHGLCYVVDAEGYRNAVTDFTETYLK